MAEEFTPLEPINTSATHAVGRYRIPEGSTAEDVLDSVRNRWFDLYHPAGYGTHVYQIGQVKDGIITIAMSRSRSCE